MGVSVDVFIWNTLSKKSCLLFGQECVSVVIWVILTLLFRTLLYFTNSEGYLPRGLIYAFPFFIQLAGKLIPFIKKSYPILTVRLAENLVGKVSPSKILVIIPAHLFGAVLGVVIFKSVLPFIPNDIVEPLSYESSWWVKNLLMEIVVNFLYITTLLVLPYIFEINRITTKLVSLPIFPLLFLRAPFDTCTFNPAIIYALWYVNSCSSLFTNFASLPLERIVGPILGALLAGIFCNHYFPDDPNSWSRKKDI